RSRPWRCSCCSVSRACCRSDKRLFLGSAPIPRPLSPQPTNCRSRSRSSRPDCWRDLRASRLCPSRACAESILGLPHSAFRSSSTLSFLTRNGSPAARSGYSTSSPSLGPWILKSETANYLFCLAVLVAAFITLHRLLPTRFGRALQAIMLDEDAERASGINVTYYK